LLSFKDVLLEEIRSPSDLTALPVLAPLEMVTGAARVGVDVVVITDVDVCAIAAPANRPHAAVPASRILVICHASKITREGFRLAWFSTIHRRCRSVAASDCYPGRTSEPMGWL
jgi:hypothetical protein